MGYEPISLFSLLFYIKTCLLHLGARRLLMLDGDSPQLKVKMDQGLINDQFE